MATTAESVAVTLVLALILIASLVLNILFIVVFVRTRYARDCANFLLLNMALADLLASLLWLLPSLVAAGGWAWPLGSHFCRVQTVFATWCYVVNLHTFLAVAIEKALRFWKPSKHPEVFYKTVVLVLMLGIWIFDLVIALFPIMGWGEIAYLTPLFQCAVDPTINHSHLVFSFLITFCVPLIAASVLFALTFYKIRKLQSQVTPGRPIVLEERRSVPEVSYAQKFERSQRKFSEKVGARFKRKSADEDRKELDATGYDSDDSNASDVVHNGSVPEREKQQRLFLLREADYKLTVTVFIAWVVYQLLWLPHIVLLFFWAFNFTTPPPSGVMITFTIVTFLSLVIKPLIYVTNRRLRRSVPRALRRRKADYRNTSQ